MQLGPIAYVSQTDIPGLVDVVVSDGRTFGDLTLGQLRYLVVREGWQLQPAQ